MIKSTVIVFMCFISLLSQNRQYKINQIDFSRFPFTDIYITIQDENKNVVKLAAADNLKFQIKHNNKLINVESYENVSDLKEKGQAELFIGMVFDNSVSMQGNVKTLVNAAESFIDSLQFGEYVSMFDFGGSNNQKLMIKGLDHEINGRQKIGFSQSKKLLKSKIESNLISKTFMYDALVHAMDRLNEQTVLGQKVIIFFSDGNDIGSSTSREEVTQFINKLEIPIYAIDLNTKTNRYLKEFAELSGGEYYLVKNPKELSQLYSNVAKVLKSQYRFTFKSQDGDINLSKHSTEIIENGKSVGISKSFQIDAMNVGYYNLTYREQENILSIENCLNYLNSFTQSKFKNNVKIKMQKIWSEKGDYNKALAVLNNILRYPNSEIETQALIEKADIYKKLRQYKLAQEAYQSVLNKEQEPNIRAKAMLELAKTYSASGNYSDAITTYNDLSVQFEGTELASEAIFQSAALNLDMGNLSDAETKLESLVELYDNSGSNIFAKNELATIKFMNKATSESMSLLSEIVSSNKAIDPDLITQSKLMMAEVHIESNQLLAANEVLSDVAMNSPKSQFQILANTKKIPINYNSGNIAEAKNSFERLPSLYQNAMINKGIQYPVTIGTSTGIALPQGVLLAAPNALNVTNMSINTVEWPEMNEKFAIEGPIYQFGFDSTKTRIHIPNTKKEKESNLIYHYENGFWVLVEATYVDSLNSFVFETEKPGFYTILSERPVVFRLYSIYFDVNKATIKTESEKSLYAMIDGLKAYPDINIEIAGHSDNTGSDKRNTELSLERANSIKAFFVENGIDETRLTTKGFGSKYPIVPNTTAENRTKNRRTEFTVVSRSAQLGTRQNKNIEFFVYVVRIQEFKNQIDAYALKSSLKKQNIDATVLTYVDREGKKIKYDLILGHFLTEEDAQIAVTELQSNIKNLNPEIIKSEL